MKTTTLGKWHSYHFICTVISLTAVVFGGMAFSPLDADEPPATTAGAYNDRVVAFIDTRSCDIGLRTPDNPGGWIETRPCDDNVDRATIDTAKPVGILINFR